jgi:hypothetical protein
LSIILMAYLEKGKCTTVISHEGSVVDAII